MTTKLFSKEVLQELVWGDVEGLVVMLNEQYSSSRWSSLHELVFREGEKYYRVEYSRGLTECQDERPFEYEGDMISCTEVVPYEKTVIAYKNAE